MILLLLLIQKLALSYEVLLLSCCVEQVRHGVRTGYQSRLLMLVLYHLQSAQELISGLILGIESVHEFSLVHGCSVNSSLEHDLLLHILEAWRRLEESSVHSLLICSLLKVLLVKILLLLLLLL